MHIYAHDKSRLKKICIKAGKKITLVSGNAGDEENLHPSGRKFNFLINFIEFFK